MTLTEFLLARIAEDEAVAVAATPGPWRDCVMGSEGSDVQAGGYTITTARRPARCREFADAVHIARHDPTRVLSECRAKRQIVELFPSSPDGDGWNEAGGRVLELLALLYADHPDYHEEWRA